IPAVVLALVAWITLDRGLSDLFSARTRAVLQSSVEVARQFDQSRREGLIFTVQLIKRQADENNILERTPAEIQDFVNAGAFYTKFPVFLLRPDGSIISKTKLDPEPELPLPPKPALDAAVAQNRVVTIDPGTSDHI